MSFTPSSTARAGPRGSLPSRCVLALWASSLVGRRSYRNTKAVLNDVILRGRLVGIPLIATDGFEYYFGVIARLIGPACCLRSGAQDSAEQSRHPGRSAREGRHRDPLEERSAGVGGFRDPERAHTSFVERLNLTIRQGSAYLRRRSPCHARGADQLCGHVELLRCHYNFVRPHSALKFGRETRTPAMQAGLASKPLTWHDIFTARHILCLPSRCGRASLRDGLDWTRRRRDGVAESKSGCLNNSEWRKHQNLPPGRKASQPAEV